MNTAEEAMAAARGARMVRNGRTREKIAADLWERLERGPHFSAIESLNGAEVRNRFRGWSESWILRDLAALIPELRSKLDQMGNLK